jgi:hypothetical protein
MKNVCPFPGCKQRLTLTSIKCKCEKTFCVKHTYYTEHGCTFDYAAEGRNELMKIMSAPVIAVKLNTI